MSSQEIAHEQHYVSMLYAHLDGLRTQAAARLGGVLRETGGTHQAHTERTASSGMYSAELARLDAAEHGLCFGRLDLDDGGRRYIGRMGLFDADADYEPLLLDWRAPAARPFYLATAASPKGVTRRRHIRTNDRTVVGLDDDVLDFGTVDPDRPDGLVGEAALLAAVAAGRTGRMGDIVETIQAEQDRIISSAHNGALVVQGGPGTGKTAVALHRAAFLLYTHRERLSRSGVLIVGPNTTFLRYIEQVLPSLGETDVWLTTVGELYPGVRANRAEPPEAAEVKGRLAMAGVLAAAVRDRQRVPDADEPLEVAVSHDVLLLDRLTCEIARDRARESRLPHNEARLVFAREVVAALAEQTADRIGADLLGGPNLLGPAELAEIRRELSEDDAVDAAVEELWPGLTPQRLLADLYASAERLASAAPGLTAAERDLLRRAPGGGWTVADVPLLDEAAELLGVDDRVTRAAQARAQRARIAEAQGVLDILAGSAAHELDDPDPEVLMAYDLVDAGQLAQRHTEGPRGTVAQRAAADRTWAFGHVIVDEAQELSEMAWRMLMRRSPNRSMTIVGDVDQTGDLAGTTSWDRVLRPYLADRWRLAALTVNYRTPAEIMAVAAGLLPGSDPPRSVRESGAPPWRLAVAPDEVAGRLVGIVDEELARLGNGRDGRLAVIVPAARLDELRAAIAGGGPAAPDLEQPVVVLSVQQAKGLEFDTVLVVEPERILTESPRGTNDLYVGLTRATRRLGVVHTGELPPALAALRPADPERTRVEALAS